MARDKYVIELEDYFDQPKFSSVPEGPERWAVLNQAELELLKREIEACKASFIHTASNWFWISDKSGREVLFDLWDGQMLVVEKLQDMASRGKPQYVVVIKSRQLGLSQLGCALGAHKCFFTSNQNGLIISEDDSKTENLWNSYILPIYRKLPWFLRPNAISLTIKNGIVLDSDPKRTNTLGLRSSIKTVSASSSGYVGQGTRLNFFHGSEFTSWPTFNDIIERGIQNALHSSPESIGILESTAKGAGTATHSFWNRMSRLGDAAKWEPVFLPFFMDKTHVLAPHKGWTLSDRDKKRREGVEANWVRCNHRDCGKYFNRIWSLQDMADTTCRFCKTGKFKPYLITDQQLYWMTNEESSASDEKFIQQEQAITAEEAFLTFGDKVFSDAAIEYACFTAEKSARTIPIKGFFDARHMFHGFRDGGPTHEGVDTPKCECAGCTQDHRRDDRDLIVWEVPQPGAEYCIGVDVSEGIGKDYSVACVIKKGNGTPDLHVATYRERKTNPFNLAYKIAPLGNWYNTAQVAIEYTGSGSSTADALLNLIRYNNIYRRKISGDFSKTQGNGYHWLTNAGSKPKLISSMERWLSEELLIIRDFELVNEIKVFVKQEESKKTEAAKQRGAEYHDDYLMAMMITVYTAHQMDFDENGGMKPFKIDPTPENQPYIVSCNSCGLRVGVSDPNQYRKCAKCHSMHMVAQRNTSINLPETQNPYKDIITGLMDSYEGSNYGPDFEDSPYVPYF